MRTSSELSSSSPPLTRGGPSSADPRENVPGETFSSPRHRAGTRERNSSGDELHLQFRVRGAATALAEKTSWGNLRVARPTIDAAGRNNLIVQHVGPGLLPGDTLNISAHLEAGTDVALTGQGATRIFPSSDVDDTQARAEVRTDVRIDSGASLLALWDPVIPYRSSRLLQETNLEFSRDSKIVWMDTLAAGRVASGETFDYDLLTFISRWKMEGREIMAERLELTPRSVRSMLGWKAARFMTTLVAFAPECESFELSSWIKSARDNSGEAAGASDWSVTRPHPRLLVLRSLGLTREDAQRPALELVSRLHPILWGRPFVDFRKY